MPTENIFIVGLIAELSIFSDLDFSTLNVLCDLFSENTYQRGQVIFDEGSIGNSMMVIISGEVRISQKPSPEMEEALTILKKGDVFGEMALLDDMKRSATAIAHSNLVILEITRENFFKFIEANPRSGIKIVFKLAKILSQRLREADNKMKYFTSLSKWL